MAVPLIALVSKVQYMYVKSMAGVQRLQMTCMRMDMLYMTHTHTHTYTHTHVHTQHTLTHVHTHAHTHTHTHIHIHTHTYTHTHIHKWQVYGDYYKFLTTQVQVCM
jgi:hypothetical protein